jgi:hypothetical protein
MSTINTYKVYYKILNYANQVIETDSTLVKAVKGYYIEDLAKIYLSLDKKCRSEDIEICDVILHHSDFIDDGEE